MFSKCSNKFPWGGYRETEACMMFVHHVIIGVFPLEKDFASTRERCFHKTKQNTPFMMKWMWMRGGKDCDRNALCENSNTLYVLSLFAQVEKQKNANRVFEAICKVRHAVFTPQVSPERPRWEMKFPLVYFEWFTRWFYTQMNQRVWMIKYFREFPKLLEAFESLADI